MWERIEWLLLDRVRDGVELSARAFCPTLADRPRAGLATVCSTFEAVLGACFLNGLGVDPAEPGKVAGF